MARDYAKLLCSAWTEDEDWRSRTGEAQRLYLLALSQPDVSYAGIVPYRPRRWATMSKDASMTKVRRGLAELEANGYVVVDADTEELLIRSFIRHDNPLKVPNMARAMVSAIRAILSYHLRDVVLSEIARLHDSTPPPGSDDRPKGWDAVVLRPRAEGGLLEDLEATLRRRDQ
jgi:hypothetical protein